MVQSFFSWGTNWELLSTDLFMKLLQTYILWMKPANWFKRYHEKLLISFNFFLIHVLIVCFPLNLLKIL